MQTRILVHYEFPCKINSKSKKALIPLLETFIDGHPDVKVDFRIRDIIARQQLIEARGVLLQHVPMVLPAPTLCEHLQDQAVVLLLYFSRRKIVQIVVRVSKFSK